MNLQRHILLLSLLILLPSIRTQAVTLRYSIIVGNNQGVDTEGKEPFPKLKFAEEEARHLRDKLVELANFDPSSSRTKLLLGATRAQVLEAVAELNAQKQADLKAVGSVNTLFTFFFTGHGLSGKLLLNDGPLTGEELGRVFQTMNADFTVGVFDACYSGSLEQSLLIKKGVQRTPGINLFRELPEEVLQSEGSVWFVSSGPDEFSFEDQRLGGVFTHFFTEALEKAQADGPGITLERIWHYVRENTVAYTANRGQQQVPQQYVARLKSTGPLYFSFPTPRTSRLVLAESVSGRFVLSYAEGQWSETFEKYPGQIKELSVYPGNARLMLLKDGQISLQENILFPENGRIVLHGNQDLVSSKQLGQENQTLWVKGEGSQAIVATAMFPKSSMFLGAGYQFRFFNDRFLFASHQALLHARWDWSRWSLAVQFGYGRKSDSFESWSYQANVLGLGAKFGLGWDVGPFRLSANTQVSGAVAFQKFQDGQSRERILFQPGFSFGGLLPIFQWLALEASVYAGAARLSGVGVNTGYYWQGEFGGEVALLVRAF